MKKKHIIHSAALLLGLCLAGCKESLPDNFGAIEGIYFYNQLTDRTVVDSAAYTFIYEDAYWSVVKICTEHFSEIMAIKCIPHCVGKPFHPHFSAIRRILTKTIGTISTNLFHVFAP